MILSRALGLVFLKGQKVAGTSVEMALSLRCGPDDVITPITPVDERARLAAGGRGAQNWTRGRHGEEAAYLDRVSGAAPGALAALRVPDGPYYNHMSLAEVVAAAGPIPAGWTVFAVERCPYRKVLSWTNMMAGYRRYLAEGTIRTDRAALARALDRALATGAVRAARNIERYRGPDGRIAARVLRYDRLADEFAALMAERGIEPPALPHAKRGLMAETVDLDQVLTPAQIRRINDLFADEFAAFGYPMR